MSIERNDKAHLNIGVLVIIYLFCLLPLLYTNTATFANSSLLFLCLFCFNVLGKLILRPLRTDGFLIPFTDTALCILTGGLAFSMLIFVNPGALFLIPAMVGVAMVSGLLLRKCIHIGLKPGAIDVVAFACILPAILLISSYDLFEQFSESISNRNLPTIDNYYFTSLVATLRHGSTASAAYEVGSPVSYQLLGFFIPAALANILNVSSHQALWGIAQPLYKLLAFALCYEVLYSFMKGRVGRNNYLFVALAIFLPLLLAPLHPLYVLRGKIEYFILIGNGFMWPNGKLNWEGTITIPLSVVLFLFSLLLFFRASWNERKVTAEKVAFCICVALIINAKSAMFVPYFAFIAVVMLKRILFDRHSVVSYAVGIVSILFLSVFINSLNSQESGFVRTYIQYGFLAEQMAESYKRSNVGMKNQVVTFLLIPVTYLLWLSIRMLGLWWIVKAKVSALSDVLIGGIGALLGASALALFVRRINVDEMGKVLSDSTPDSMQAVVCSFYILTIVACIGMLYYFYNGKKTKWLYASYAITAIWCVISLGGIVYVWNDHTKNTECKDCEWYFDNMALLKAGKLNDGLIAVNPDEGYNGVMLAASDHGKYWTAMGSSPGHYNSSGKNMYRWRLYSEWLFAPKPEHFARMKQEGVKYIVAIPHDSVQIAAIQRQYPAAMHKMEGTEWVYVLE